MPPAARTEEFLGYYPAAELVFAIVCPLGIDYKKVVATLKNYLQQFGYRAKRPLPHRREALR